MVYLVYLLATKNFMLASITLISLSIGWSTVGMSGLTFGWLLLISYFHSWNLLLVVLILYPYIVVTHTRHYRIIVLHYYWTIQWIMWWLIYTGESFILLLTGMNNHCHTYLRTCMYVRACMCVCVCVCVCVYTSMYIHTYICNVCVHIKAVVLKRDVLVPDSDLYIRTYYSYKFWID